MSDIVIFHKNCFDGVTAALVIRHYHALRRYPTPECIGANYGDAPPDVTDKEVVIVDFSYKRPVLQEMTRRSRTMLVLDHHETAQKDLEGLPYALFDMNRSGAGLAWDWFFPGQPRPWLVNCVEDRDLWKFKRPETKNQMAYIATVPMDWESWGRLWFSNPDRVAADGEAIQKYIENYGMKAMEHTVMLEIGGYAFPLINIPYMNCSDHLDLIMNHSVFTRAASFFLRSDRKWQFSLRSQEGDVNVADIAKQYGGGGHAHAAGFQLESAVFMQLMSEVRETR